MTNATEQYSKLMQDMMDVFPINDTALQALGKVQSELTDQMTKTVLEAVEKSTAVSTKWTAAALAKTAELAKTSDHPNGHLYAMTDFISLTTEMATDYFTNYSEIAKQVQLETIKIMLTTRDDLLPQATTKIEEAVATSQQSPSVEPKETGAAAVIDETEAADQPAPSATTQDHQLTQETAPIQKKPTQQKTKA